MISTWILSTPCNIFNGISSHTIMSQSKSTLMQRSSSLLPGTHPVKLHVHFQVIMKSLISCFYLGWSQTLKGCVLRNIVDDCCINLLVIKNCLLWWFLELRPEYTWCIVFWSGSKVVNTLKTRCFELVHFWPLNVTSLCLQTKHVISAPKQYSNTLLHCSKTHGLWSKLWLPSACLSFTCCSAHSFSVSHSALPWQWCTAWWNEGKGSWRNPNTSGESF